MDSGMVDLFENRPGSGFYRARKILLPFAFFIYYTGHEAGFRQPQEGL